MFEIVLFHSATKMRGLEGWSASIASVGIMHSTLAAFTAFAVGFGTFHGCQNEFIDVGVIHVDTERGEDRFDDGGYHVVIV